MARFREAIDARLTSPDASTRRAAAAGVLLDLPRPADPEPDWSSVKDARLDDALA